MTKKATSFLSEHRFGRISADGDMTNDLVWVYVWDAENRLIQMSEELQRREWNAQELARRRKSDEEKLKMAQRLRSETTMTWAWIASHVQMGTAGYAANCLRPQ